MIRRADKPPPTRDPLRPALRRVDSAALFQGARRLVIEHNGDAYLLLITQRGKLILTK